MPHQPLAVCLFCHRPLAPGELAVFQDEAKIAHVRCWRLPPVTRAPRPLKSL